MYSRMPPTGALFIYQLYRKPRIHGIFMNSVQTHFFNGLEWEGTKVSSEDRRSLFRYLKRWLIIIADNFSHQRRPHKEGEKQHKGIQDRKYCSVPRQISCEKGRKTKPPHTHTTRDVMRANLCSLFSRMLLLLQSHRQHSYECPWCYWHYEYFLSCALQI